MVSDSTWFGSFDLELEEVRRWRLGSLTLWVQRHATEWRVAWQYGDRDQAVGGQAMDTQSEFPAKYTRFGFERAPATMQLVPRLADRSAVFEPDQSVYLVPGAKTRILVGGPIWLTLRLGGLATDVLDIPTQIMSRAWFGPSTREGVLCYSARTSAVTDFSQMEKASHRALTTVFIANRTKQLLPIERIRIPLNNLSLYCDKNQDLWTTPIRFENESDQDFARMSLSEAELGDMRRVSEAREQLANPVVRVFSSLISSELWR